MSGDERPISGAQTALAVVKAAQVPAGPRAPRSLEECAVNAGLSGAESVVGVQCARAFGLAIEDDFGDGPVMVTAAGRQLIERGGEADASTLVFLAEWVDDLYAREALVVSADELVSHMHAAMVIGEAEDFFRDFVPPAFSLAVDADLSVRMFEAATGLVARLGAGRAAGCLAEEIVAVRLIESAEDWLAVWTDEERITEQEAKVASAAFGGIFELFEDADVLKLFEMVEPGDAALLASSPEAEYMAYADTRVERWFDAFGGQLPLGHLRERPGD